MFAVILTSVRFQLKSVVDLGRTQTYRASSAVADGVNEQRAMECWRGGRAAYIIFRECPVWDLRCHQYASNAVLRVPAVQHRNSCRLSVDSLV